MLNFNAFILFSDNSKSLSDFYRKVFQKEPAWNEGDFTGFQVGGGHFMVGPHDKVKGKNNNPERQLVNFETDEVEKEFERIELLGAKVIAKPYHPMEATDMWLATFEDPDGNYFQLASPMK